MATQKRTIGKLPVYRGAYVSGMKYSRLNIVSYLGSSFISQLDDNGVVPCVVENDILKASEGWEFLADASFGVKLINDREEDIEKSVFEAKKENGELNPNKRYFIYEE